MKKELVLMLSIAVLALAVSCHNKTAPAITSRTEQPPPPPPPVPPMNVVAKADIEAGRMVYTGQCVKCHQAKPVDNWTNEEWQPILRSMIRKARLDSMQSMQVTAYVAANAKK